jgi:hypothetical protein
MHKNQTLLLVYIDQYPISPGGGGEGGGGSLSPSLYIYTWHTGTNNTGIYI